MNGRFGQPPPDVIARMRQVAPEVPPIVSRAPQLITAQFRLLTPRSTTLDGRFCTESMRVAQLGCKSVTIHGTSVQCSIEVSIADDHNKGDSWVPLVVGITSPDISAIEESSVEVCPRAIRIVMDQGELAPLAFPADFKAFFSGLWMGEGPYCGRVQPYNL